MPTFLNSSMNNSYPVNPVSWNHSIIAGENRVLIVCVCVQGGGSHSFNVQPTLSGLPLSLLTQASQIIFGSRQSVFVYCVLNNNLPTPGLSTIQYQMNNGPYSSASTALLFSNVNQSDLANYQAFGDSSNPLSGPINNSLVAQKDSSLLDVVTIRPNNELSENVDQTPLTDITSSDIRTRNSIKSVITNGLYQMQWSPSGNYYLYNQILIELKGSQSTKKRPFLMLGTNF